MATRRARREPPRTLGERIIRTLKYYAIMAVYTVVAMVFIYFLVMWAMGNIVDAATNVMKATPTVR